MLLYMVVVSFVFMSENFESGNIPNNWSIYDHGVQGATWFAASTGTEWLEPENHGSYYALLDYGVDSLANDTLVSPSVDLTTEHTSLYLTYSMAFMGDTTICDTGRVIIRYFIQGSWGTWTTLMAYGGDIIQNAETLDIYNASFDADSLQVGFVYATDTTSGGGYFAVDNIEITGGVPSSNDVEVIDILSPKGYIGDSTSPVNILVTNNSDSSLSGVPLQVVITDTVTGTEVYSDNTTFNIQPGETLSVALSDFTPTSDTSFYNVLAYTSLSGDSTPQNDTAYAFAYSYPIFGSVMAKWEIPSTDSGWWGADYNRGILYILDAATGEVKGFNPRTGNFYHVTTLDTVFDNNRIIFWDLAYDYEAGNWWVTAFKQGGSPNYSYVLKYDSLWHFITGRAVPSGSDSSTIGIPASIDDKPFASNILYTASFPQYNTQPYTLIENDFDNLDSITFIDNVKVVQMAGVPATLGLISDTLFLMQSAGFNAINLVSVQRRDTYTTYTILAHDTLPELPSGGDIEYRYGQDPNHWIVAYLTIEGHAIYKVSMGMRWDKVNISEKHNYRSHIPATYFLNKGVLPASLYSNLKGKNIRIYSPNGRLLFEGTLKSPILPLKKSGIFFINAGTLHLKLLNR